MTHTSTEDGADKGVSGIDGPVSRWLNRPLSRRISGLRLSQQLTPDQWSWIAFVAVCAGAGAFSAGRPRLGATLCHAGSVIDGVDGEVARNQGTANPAGALLDLVLDRVGDVAVLAGLAQGSGGTRGDWLMALAAANGILVSGLTKERLGAEQQSVRLLQEEEGQRHPIDRLVPWTGRDGRLLAVTAAGLARKPRVALGVLAVLANVRLVRRFAAARSMLRAAAGPEKPHHIVAP
ncbi:MAG: CDP-alcohol phosphatidyltransferase family protein [Dehalococcoidia bacterium]